MKKSILTIIFLLLFLPFSAHARNKADIYDWYIKDFNSQIIVNQDSSLDITETIVADCGNLPDKHGIYRIIPSVSYGEDGEIFKTPIKIKSINNGKGDSYEYQTSNNSKDNTLTIKIGSPNYTVSGENTYIISYKVDNAIRFTNDKFDELYWNLNGNFWQLQIDNYSADIIFPETFDSSLSEVNVYYGSHGSAELSENFKWQTKNHLYIASNGRLLEGQGITSSITYPKGLFEPYVAPFYDRFAWLWLIILPLLFFILCYKIWQKNGRDPQINPTVAPEFEIPEDLNPIDMGMIISDGKFNNKYLTASIVNLAVKGYLIIEKIDTSGIIKIKEYNFKKTGSVNLPPLTPSEEKLYERLFGNTDEISTSSLKNKFYVEIPKIQSSSMDYLSSKKWIIKSSRYWQLGFIVFSISLFIFSFITMDFNYYFGYGLLASSIIIFFFSFVMTKRSIEGARLFKRILGFKLYMSKAEKYRQQFNEKENIFEIFLPYAIVFGITGLWIKQIRNIYGEKYINSFHPIWFIGTGQSFNFNSFTSEMKNLSSNIGNTIAQSPSSGGSGGGGFSGGGGGGGGGGGW